MFQLDIDRLHKVFNGEIRHRGCGVTTAVCYQAIGYAQVEDKDIFIIGEHLYVCKHIIRQLIEILDYERIPFIIKDSNKFEFIFESNEKEWLQRYAMRNIVVCKREQYDDRYKRGRHSENDILLYDFTEGYFQGFNSAQSTWDNIVKAEEILWSKYAGINVTHY